MYNVPMKFEVPQFIEVEDKIFGPLTWRQFVYLGGGVGMAVALYFFLPFIAFAFIGIPLALVAVALAFYPVNNRPFSHFLEAMFNFTFRPKRYLWRKERSYVYHEGEEQAYQSPVSGKTTVRKSGTDIAAIARKLELEAIQKTDI